MLVNLYSAAITGLNPRVIKVEIDISMGIPYFSVVGLADATVKESWARVKGAITNSGFTYPKSKVTINLAPGWVRKKGSHFDLSFALGILIATNQLSLNHLEHTCVIGELSLDGTINKCAGILPMIMEAKKEGMKIVIVPYDNLEESMLLSDIEVYGARNLSDLVAMLKRSEHARKIRSNEFVKATKTNMVGTRTEEFHKDFKDVKGQNAAKRAVVIAVAGGHSLMITGCPGIGKTMIAERIPEIMPPLSYDEALELTSIYSAAGKLSEKEPIVSQRPFRNPGSLITKAALIGGGFPPSPGEITFAHRGVLFLDEIGEMKRDTLDALRKPLEDKNVLLVRRGEQFIFPADFFLIGAKNPCKCGFYGSKVKTCTCSRKEILDYQNNLSGPIMDRIHMHITLPDISYDDMSNHPTNSVEAELDSAKMKEIILRAREIQKERYKEESFSLNGNIEAGKLDKYCHINKEAKAFLSKAYKELALNPRTYSNTLKVARTIADVDGSETIEITHLAQAIQYREQVIK